MHLPCAYPPTLRELTDIFEPPGFSILDIENLRLHYAKTLRHWLLRFEAASGRVARTFDQQFVRAWRLYLSGSCAAFTAGGLQLFQVLVGRPGVNSIPWNRAAPLRLRNGLRRPVRQACAKSTSENLSPLPKGEGRF